MMESQSFEQQLDELQAESELRRAELKQIAAALPATMGRGALLRATAADLRRAPDKGIILRRSLRKVLRASRSIARRAIRRPA